MSERPILVAYDGSHHGDHTIAVAGEIFPGERAYVAYVWEPAAESAVGLGIYLTEADNTPGLLDGEHGEALKIARRGVELARAAGLDATGGAVNGSEPRWQLIEQVAQRCNPRVIVLGSHRQAGFRAAVSGSTYQHVIAHSHYPVLAVPLHTV